MWIFKQENTIKSTSIRNLYTQTIFSFALVLIHQARSCNKTYFQHTESITTYQTNEVNDFFHLPPVDWLIYRAHVLAP